MRILYLSSSGQLGGAERVLLDLAASLRRSHPAWELHLTAVEPGPLVSAASALGVAATVLPLPRAVADLGEAGASPGRVAWTLAGAALPLWQYVAALRRHIAEVGPSIVHSHGLKTHVASAIAARDVPVVWHLHDYVGARKVTAMLLRRFAGRVALAIANSASVAADFTTVCGRRVPVTTVLNGVDVEALSPTGPALDLDALSGLPHASAGTVRVGLMATFARWKGHLTFLDALSRVPRDLPLRGYVIGGPLYQTAGSQVTLDELHASCARLGLDGRVGFAGFQSDRGAALRALDVAVHASTLPEPFGLVIAEAMSTGRAVVTTASGGASELVRPGIDALSTPPGDAEAMARALARLAGDQALRESLGHSARQAAVSRFSRARFSDEITQVYAQLAGRMRSA
jgi:glycosyltransferase involved in cell wall biosynthesis